MFWKLSNNLIESVRGHIKYLESVEPSEPNETVEEIDLKIEENVRWKEIHYNAPELSKFRELLTRDSSNLNRWVKVS